MKYIVALISFFIIQSAWAYRFNKVVYVKNYDGDTVTVNLPSVHPLLGDNIGIRVKGIDTPEIRGKTQCEKDKAIEAKEFVRQTLTKAKRIIIRDASRGKYFRIVGDIIADKRSIGKLLIDKKLAVPYDGGKKPVVDWCNL